jgi:tRNA A-37 threonylcarbamoyl transferase component Bud32
VKFQSLADISPVFYTTTHALRRLSPDYKSPDVIRLNAEVRSTKRFVHSYNCKKRLNHIDAIPTVRDFTGTRPYFKYCEEYVHGRRLLLSDLSNPSITFQIGKCLVDIAEAGASSRMVHGDTHFNNFLIRKRDNKLFLVDFDSAFKAPFLFDLLYFIVYVFFEIEHSSQNSWRSSWVSSLFRQLMTGFENSTEFSDHINEASLSNQWNFLAKHLDKMWGDHTNNRKFHKIIENYSGPLTASYFQYLEQQQDEGSV